MSFLSLSKCCIPIRGAHTLVREYISEHKGLQGLDLSYNPFGTDEEEVDTIALNLLVR